MKFTYLVAILAISTLALNASAYTDGTDGTLRRQVAEADVTTDSTTININTAQAPAPAPAQQPAVQQPTTTVEAPPAAPSKAEVIRKARVNEEVHTEQKIVEKLEDSRLQEEKDRADRLFGNKLDPQPAQPAAAVVVTPPPPAAPAPVAPPPPAPIVQQDKPAQVNIEKVEIIEPAKPAPVAEPVAESTADAKDEKPVESNTKYYVSGLAGNVNYGAANVHSNYALGVAVGEIIDNKWGVEIGYMYSNHNIDDLWSTQIFHTLDQSDFYGAAKYYFLPGKLKPYVGGSLTYVNRKYTDRIYNNYGYGFGNNSSQIASTETTQSVDAGILGGVDFALTDSFSLGAGADYNFNVMNMQNIDETYLPPGSQALEKISYWTLKVTGKFTF